MTSILLGTDSNCAYDEIISRLNAACDDDTSIDKFFLLRMKRATNVAVYCHPFRSERYPESDWGPGRQSSYSVATDINGIPVYFEPFSEMDMNIHSVRALVDHVIKMGATEPTVILDFSSSSAENLKYLIDAGIGFLASGGKKTPAIKQMLGQVVKKRGDPRALRHYGDRNYIVFDSEVAVFPKKVPKRPDSPEENNETDELEIIAMSDPRFSSVSFDEHMIAWACTENEGNSDRNREQMMSKLSEIESRLMEIDPYEAVDNLKSIAGDYYKYFDLEVVEGELEVKIRQKGVTAALNREGIFVIVTYGLKNWNTTMSYYENISKLERMSKVMASTLSAGTLSETPPTERAWMIVQFCALVLWRMMEKRLQDSGEGVTVRAALQSLDMIVSIGDGTRWQTTEVSPYSKHMLDLLHISLPRGSISTHSGSSRSSGDGEGAEIGDENAQSGENPQSIED